MQVCSLDYVLQLEDAAVDTHISREGVAVLLVSSNKLSIIYKLDYIEDGII